MGTDALDDHIQGHQVVAPLQHDDIGVLAAGLDILLVHRLDGGKVLADDAFQRPPPLLHVPEDTTQDAGVGVGVHEYLDVHLFPQPRVLEDEDAFGDDHLGGADLHRVVGAVVDGVIVDGAAHRLPCPQPPQVLHHHGGVKGVGMVVVQLGPLLVAEFVVALVVVVVVDDADILPEVLLDLPGDGGLAAAGAPGDADDHSPSCGAHFDCPLVVFTAVAAAVSFVMAGPISPPWRREGIPPGPDGR